MKVKEVISYKVVIEQNDAETIETAAYILDNFCRQIDCEKCPLEDCDCIENTIEVLKRFLHDSGLIVE